MKKNNRVLLDGRPSSLQSGWFILLGLLLAAFFSARVLFPWRVTSANTATQHFSGERAMSHLPIIAKEPHPEGSPAQENVRDYLIEQLTDIGLEVEVQKSLGAENVVARIPGSDPTGSIVILAHFDSAFRSPGAGDNGSGVSALLEVMRALAQGPALRNSIIALFDDGEELPGEFTGAKAFVKESSWMADVRVAISLDTAIAGPISINETGPGNGWLMPTLARAYNGGAWTSMSGGGNYDCTPFREAGIQVIALESNYPFWQKHSSQDTPEIVQSSSVQQMGDQTLAITRELGELDLTNLRGKQETFFEVLSLVFIHYPETLTTPLVIVAMIFFVITLVMALRNRFATLSGLAIGLGSVLLTTVIAAIGIGALWPRLPDLLGWKTSAWPEWPEVIPPNGGWIDIIFALLVFGLAVGSYRLVRRWSKPVDYSLAGLIPLLIAAVATAFTAPRGAYLFTWPVLISSVGWIAGFIAMQRGLRWALEMSLVLSALMVTIFILPFLPGVVMADGMKSLAILAGVEALILGVVFPAIDRLLVHQPNQK